MASDAPGTVAALTELAAGLEAADLPPLAFRAEAASLNALLLLLDARLRALGHTPVLSVRPDPDDQMRLVLDGAGRRCLSTCWRVG